MTSRVETDHHMRSEVRGIGLANLTGANAVNVINIFVNYMTAGYCTVTVVCNA